MNPQCMKALSRANKVRLARAELKRRLHDGTVSLADCLDESCVAEMRAGALLEAQYRWGERRANRALAVAGVGYLRVVRDLTERQRSALLRVCARGPQAIVRSGA